MLQAILSRKSKQFQEKKMKPEEEAAWYISIGIDQDGMEARPVNEKIGLSLTNIIL